MCIFISDIHIDISFVTLVTKQYISLKIIFKILQIETTENLPI